MRPEFASITFTQPEQSAQTLESLLSEERPGLAEHLAHALAENPEPSLALTRLERFLEASITPGAILDLMGAALHFCRLLITVLGQSHFLTDIVCRNPEYLLWVWEEGNLHETPPREMTVEDMRRQVMAFDTFEARAQSMRRFKRREILRIASRDIFAHVPLAALTEDLSNLADAALEVAMAGAYADLTPRYGRPRIHDTDAESTFVILGMGKLGGRELNFSSDIDLVFLYAADGETSGGESGSISNAEFFHKFGERVIKSVSEVTAEGSIFRIDMRLRPHGRMGPLASDIDSAIHYYETEGHAWERQALIKTRPVAGDLKLGDAFIERTRPFVFPRYFDDETLEDIRSIKQQMEQQVRSRGQTDTEVKLGRGGIRDVEFTVQILQLLNGGRFPELRTRNTLTAIRALEQYALLKPFDATALISNYTFMRQVEHRLQIEGSQQVHALPNDANELDAFARKLGYASGVSFKADYLDRASETRAILDQFLATEGSGNRWVTDLLNPHSDGEAGMAGLARLGFKDTSRAREELIALSSGSKQRPNSLHVRQQFAAVAPGLLKALSQAIDPDATLMRLGQILANLGAPGSIYDILKYSPEVTTYLVTLVENSQFLAEMITRDPGLFDVFGRPGALNRPSTREGLEAQLAAFQKAIDADAAPYRLLAGETLRIGTRDIILHADVVALGQELTLLADVILEYAVRVARTKTEERYGGVTGGFAVFGLGKMGGCEIGYGSDLDLVFVYDGNAKTDSGMSLIEYFSAVASTIIRILKEPTRYGMLYDVDARLRPDGKKGVLVVSDTRLEEYYRTEAQPWELLALTKVRAVAGDAEFGEAVAQRVRDVAFGLELTPETLEHIEEIRAKLVASNTSLNVKKGEGGIAELEFAVRLLQIRNAAKHPELKRGDVLGAIEGLQAIGALSAGDAEMLREAYLLFRRIENRLRINLGRSVSTLPEDPGAQADLARRLGLADNLAELLDTHKARVHAVYARAVSGK
ncbi:MAG: bifunctional [glutamate--ammonia ligase]-adenylyl-L-tyrosine phosphorylase/[glutamate--ammonia-ligase] adenylyltransferase [Candidatus Hydrogenedentes bacterium]|nr:bifunctional [glutamate--ammonia ligase]-adenylyl-L-tyrosine phosphorylase/[glutamate--ammonia-ligase] adenylyltransferase [Candidatus Hydrogenedentota bacterium]